MSLVAIIAVYFVTWWTILFAVLPWGMRTQDDEGEVVLGTERGAPVRPRLLRIAVATSIAAAIIVGAFAVVVDAYGIDLTAIVDWYDGRP